MPSASIFSFRPVAPSIRYLRRQYLPPLGVTRTKRPPLSASLYGLSFGFALRILTSVSIQFPRPVLRPEDEGVRPKHLGDTPCVAVQNAPKIPPKIRDVYGLTRTTSEDLAE